MSDLTGRTIAILCATEGTEQVELTSPRDALVDAGADTEIVSTEQGPIQAFNHLDKGDTFPVDQVVGDATVDDYDALLLPGGVANPDQLRLHEDAVAFARAFFGQGKPVSESSSPVGGSVPAAVARIRTVTTSPPQSSSCR